MATTFKSFRNFVENCELFLGSLTNKQTKEVFPCIKTVSGDKEAYIFFAKSLSEGLTIEELQQEADNLQVATVSKTNEETGEVTTTNFLCRSNSNWQKFTL